MENYTQTKNELNQMLLGLLGSTDLVDQWWHSPNKAFAGNTPLEIYQKNINGRQQVTRYVTNHTFNYGGS